MKLLTYGDVTEAIGIECANGFVCRVVGEIYNSDNFGCHEDARRTAEILNAHFAALEHGATIPLKENAHVTA